MQNQPQAIKSTQSQTVSKIQTNAYPLQVISQIDGLVYIEAPTDTMYPKIAKHDLIGIQPLQDGEPVADGVYLADNNGYPTLYRIQGLTAGGYLLICDNRHYQNQTVSTLPPLLGRVRRICTFLDDQRQDDITQAVAANRYQ
ncbi:S24 family peptidase [Bergeriella denitrificans]|uniref:Peptidase S24/S26A/S26B/S26C domain-containing protein n=1 Tax=Bergeriella denitrificans TaxID=494 RepID=A0A378UHJ8_BERDE|nr:S24 family peptidase [Bergeriella denitrificans]STZ76858.1 Uncharacterised protein [Bergeriella denitrificans]